MKISNDVLAVLSECVCENNTVKIMGGALPRPLYVSVDKALQAAGGKWDRKKRAHVFDCDPADIVESMILTGEIYSAKSDNDFFETPRAVIDRMLAMCTVQHGTRVLEPSAGKGAIVKACLERGATVYCVEKCVSLYVHLVDVVGPPGTIKRTYNGDFLSTLPAMKYDVILMNPPFSKQADIRHVTHALQFLDQSGVLISVMSAGVLFRTNSLTRDFREKIVSRGGRFEALPDGSFKSSGTMVKTVLCKVGNV